MSNRWIHGLIATSLAALCAPISSADEVFFPGANTGAIPDNNPVGRTITFDVTSAHRVSRIGVALNMTHSWIGDLNATLRSPSGEAELVLFSRIGARQATSGADSSDFDGLYIFADPTPGSAPPGDLWAVAIGQVGGTLPTGGYRTSTAGMPGISDHGGCSTRMDAAFGDAVPFAEGIAAAGTWTLTISDSVGGDTGTVNTATLLIREAEDLFSDGFELVPPAQVLTNCTRTTHDLTGNGLADYTNLGANAGGLEWKTLANTGDATTGAASAFVFGDPNTDFYNSADIDGDGISDPVVFTPDSGLFKARRSSRPGSAPLEVSFGPPQLGESRYPLVVGDYDGDGLDDFAVERQREISPFGLTYLEYMRSIDGIPVVFAAGSNATSDLRSGGGVDIDGDGKADLLQRPIGSTAFVSYRGTDGMAAPPFNFGMANDPLLIAANRAGDARADVTAIRVVGTDVVWETRTTGTGATSTPLVFGAIGITGASTLVSAADYDGDGLIDYSYWLRNEDGSGPSQFFVRPSASPGTTWTIDAGGPGQETLAGARAF